LGVHPRLSDAQEGAVGACAWIRDQGAEERSLEQFSESDPRALAMYLLRLK